jgi:type II secretory pathway component GspD/PulD (secretin)
MTVQVPVQQRKVVSAIENLEIGQTLLIDPYVKHESQKQQVTGIPILSSIPYISESFTSRETVSLQQQMLVLIEPVMEAAPRPSLSR